MKHLPINPSIELAILSFAEALIVVLGCAALGLLLAVWVGP